MDKIVIIGANTFQNKLILKAKELGFETHVFAWQSGDIGEKTADFFYPISIIEKEKILNICKKIKPIGVCTIASDLANITVNYIAKNLGLTCNPEDTILKTTNKFEMRKVLKNKGLYTPKFIKTNSEKDVKNFSFPLIVKPTDRSGSRSVIKVYSQKELKNAIKNACKDSFENMAIVEEYISGQEYSCECVSYNGKHYFLTTTKKLTTAEPYFIEMGHIQPSGLDNIMEEKIKETIFFALDSLGIKNGASHSEFKINEDGSIKIIEIGSRMGGDCIGSDLVKLSTGYDFLKMVIDIAIGKEPDLKRYNKEQSAEIHFIFNEKDIKDLNRLKTNSPETIYYISDILKTDKVIDSSTRWGYYIIVK